MQFVCGSELWKSKKGGNLKNILGIGTAGCNVVEILSQHKEYKAYKISPHLETRNNKDLSCKIEQLDNPEDYESLDTTKINKVLLKVEESLTVFLSGANISTALTLRVLEPLHKRGVKIDIVYMIPETDVLSEKRRLHERSVRFVLQEYARSGVLEKVVMVSNPAIERLAEDVTVMDYYKEINTILANTYYMMDFYKNSTPVSTTLATAEAPCRISTLAIVDLESSQDHPLYNIESVREIMYYFGINEKKLQTEKRLFRNLTNRVKEKISKTTKASFAIYSTNYEQDYAYAEYYSSEIQKNT